MHWSNLIVIRYFRSRKKDKFVNLTSKIATFSISFGIAMLIVAFSVIRGFEESIFNKVLQDQGHFAIFGNGNFEAEAVARHLPKNIQYKEVIETHGMLSSGFRTETALIRGVPQQEINKLESITKHPIPEGANKAYIGYRFAKLMGIKVGDKIQLIVPVKAAPPFGIVPEQVECLVADIVKFRMHDLNRFGIFMEISDTQKMLNLGNKITKLVCFSNTPDNALQTAMKLQLALPNYNIFTWQDLNMMFADIMRIQRNMVSVILFAIIFLAIIASITSLALFINTKKREISILLILGARKGTIIRIFMKIAILISLISSIIGTALGVAFAYNLDTIRQLIEHIMQRPVFDPQIYLLPAIPVSLNISDILLVLLASFVISLLASLLPAYKSTSIDVLENL